MARRYHHQETGSFGLWVHVLIWFCVMVSTLPALWPILTGSERPAGEVAIPLVISLAIAAMSVGVMAGRRPIRGSCGGLNGSGDRKITHGCCLG